MFIRMGLCLHHLLFTLTPPAEKQAVALVEGLVMKNFSRSSSREVDCGVS